MKTQIKPFTKVLRSTTILLLMSYLPISAYAQYQDSPPEYNANHTPIGWQESVVTAPAEDWSQSPYSRSGSTTITPQSIEKKIAEERAQQLQLRAENLNKWLSTPAGRIYSKNMEQEQKNWNEKIQSIIAEIKESQHRTNDDNYAFWIQYEKDLAAQETRFIKQQESNRKNSTDIAKSLTNIMLGSENEIKNFLLWAFPKINFLNKTGLAFTKAYNTFLINQKVILEAGEVSDVNRYYYQTMAKYAAFRNFYIQEGLQQGLIDQTLADYVKKQLFRPDLYFTNGTQTVYFQSDEMLDVFYTTGQGGKTAKIETWIDLRESLTQGFKNLVKAGFIKKQLLKENELKTFRTKFGLPQ